MRLHMCPQYSTEWWRLRRGMPTASQFDRIMTPAKQQYSSGARKYQLELIAELMPDSLPKRGTGYVNEEMLHGQQTEPEARSWYEFTRDTRVQQVGFAVSDCGRYGCSPDGLVGDDGGLEIKCPQLETHLDYLDQGEVPREYLCQVHGSLLVTGRAWWDFVSYVPGLPDEQQLVLRVTPNKFTQQLGKYIERFCDELASLKSKMLPAINTQTVEEAFA